MLSYKGISAVRLAEQLEGLLPGPCSPFSGWPRRIMTGTRQTTLRHDTANELVRLQVRDPGHAHRLCTVSHSVKRSWMWSSRPRKTFPRQISALPTSTSFAKLTSLGRPLRTASPEFFLVFWHPSACARRRGIARRQGTFGTTPPQGARSSRGA